MTRGPPYLVFPISSSLSFRARRLVLVRGRLVKMGMRAWGVRSQSETA